MELAYLNDEQRTLWERVDELWRMTQTGNLCPIQQALHPDYTGWVTGQRFVHDRQDGIDSVGPSAPPVTDYKLFPLAVTVFDHLVGVVHYRYEATLQEQEHRATGVAGRWTEVYMKKSGEWIMVSVSGGPDGER